MIFVVAGTAEPLECFRHKKNFARPASGKSCQDRKTSPRSVPISLRRSAFAIGVSTYRNYGIIGNMRTVALVGMNGSIDWYCYPHFDSPSIFGAILDDKKGGRFQISVDSDGVRHKQFYWPSTNVLVTRFLMAEGIAELEDFMPVGLPSESSAFRHVYRRIRCVRGTVRISVACRPAFDYGRQAHEAQIGTNGATFRSGSLTLALSTAVPLTNDEQGGVSAEFVLSAGDRKSSFLGVTATRAGCASPPPKKRRRSCCGVEWKFWQNWLSACCYRGAGASRSSAAP